MSQRNNANDSLVLSYNEIMNLINNKPKRTGTSNVNNRTKTVNNRTTNVNNRTKTVNNRTNTVNNRTNPVNKRNTNIKNNNNTINNKNNNRSKLFAGIYPIAWSIPQRAKANCYVFGLGPAIGPGGYTNTRKFKARPGDRCSKYKDAPFDFNNCEDIVKRVLCDNPKYVTKLPPNTNVNYDCGTSYHLMAAVLSPGFNSDFHFLRRVPTKYILKEWSRFEKYTPEAAKMQLLSTNPPPYVWAHQRGWSSGGPLIHDARGNLITDPSKADYDYGDLNYSIYCGMFKVATRHATVYDYNNNY